MEIRTRVSWSKSFEKQLARAPQFIQKKVGFWIFEVEMTGLCMFTKSGTERFEKKFGRLTFGNVLRSWRLSDELSQTAFAKKLKISVQNLNDLEKGRRIPSASRAAGIAKRLGVSEMALIQLALRDSLVKEGFEYRVWLEVG